MFCVGDRCPTATCSWSPDSARNQAQQLFGHVHHQHAVLLLHSGTHCSDLQSAGTIHVVCIVCIAIYIANRTFLCPYTEVCF